MTHPSSRSPAEPPPISQPGRRPASGLIPSLQKRPIPIAPEVPVSVPSVPDTAPPPLVVCRQLRSDFPAFEISTYCDELSRPVFVARARQLGTRPAFVSSTDPGRVRAALAGQ
jgi:hypothetical protein